MLRRLLLGEGNFSFALALCRTATPAVTIATCYLPRDQLHAVYDGEHDVQATIRELQERHGVSVMYGVDATQLPSDLTAAQPFDEVFFLFPSIAQKGRIELNRQLLRDTCRSVGSAVLSREGIFFVALAAGQGGTDFERPECKREEGNSWQLQQQASYGGLFLHTACPVERHRYLGPVLESGLYMCSGRRGKASKFRTEGALMHELVRRDSLTHIPKHVLRYYPRDLSFFLGKDVVLANVLESCKADNRVETCEVLDDIVFPEDGSTKSGLRSATLRFAIRGLLSPTEAQEVLAELGRKLAKEYGVQVR